MRRVVRGAGRGRADYNEWGEITYREALSITSSYRRIYPQSSYTGHDYDDVLNLYFAKARFYSAEDKRFVAMDPVKGSADEPLSLVQYVYCLDNPLRWVDPTGMFTYDALLTLAQDFASGRDISQRIISEFRSKRNQFLIFHQITQILVSAELLTRGYQVIPEYTFNKYNKSYKGKERADVVAVEPGTGMNYVYEVKPANFIYRNGNINPVITVQINGYYNLLSCIVGQNNVAGMTKSNGQVVARIDPLTGFNRMYKLFDDGNFTLQLFVSYVGDGIISYQPWWKTKGAQAQPYYVRQANKTDNKYVRYPSHLPMSIFLRNDDFTGKEHNLFSDVDNYVTYGAVNWQSRMREDFINAGMPLLAGVYVGTTIAVVGAVAVDAGAIAAGASVVVKLKNGVTVSAKMIKSSVSRAFANAKADSTILAEMAKGALAILQATTSSGRKYVIPY